MVDKQIMVLVYWIFASVIYFNLLVLHYVYAKSTGISNVNYKRKITVLFFGLVVEHRCGTNHSIVFFKHLHVGGSYDHHRIGIQLIHLQGKHFDCKLLISDVDIILRLRHEGAKSYRLLFYYHLNFLHIVIMHLII